MKSGAASERSSFYGKIKKKHNVLERSHEEGLPGPASL